MSHSSDAIQHLHQGRPHAIAPNPDQKYWMESKARASVSRHGSRDRTNSQRITASERQIHDAPVQLPSALLRRPVHSAQNWNTNHYHTQPLFTAFWKKKKRKGTLGIHPRAPKKHIYSYREFSPARRSFLAICFSRLESVEWKGMKWDEMACIPTDNICRAQRKLRGNSSSPPRATDVLFITADACSS